MSAENKTSKQVDVIVIGAGLSGLSAAKELRANGVDVLVLEARERVGGRTLTKVEKGEDGKDLWIDLGGSYVGPTQDHLLNLLDELRLSNYLVEDSMDIAYLRSDRERDEKVECRFRFHPSADPPFGNLFHWLDYVQMVRKIDAIGARIPADAPWAADEAAEWDSKSFKQFVDENTWTQRVRSYFNCMYLPIMVTSEAEEVSMLWMLWYIKQCGGYGRSIATTNGGQERKVLNGTQQISQRLAALVGEERVLLGKPVSRIIQSDGAVGGAASGNRSATPDAESKVEVEVTTVDNERFVANHVICAVPPHLLLKIHHEPALPSEKNLLAQRSPMGQVAKVILYYDKDFWKAHGFSGFFMFDSLQRTHNPVIITLDETKPDGSHASIVGFVTARGWLSMRGKSTLEVARVVAESYARATQLDAFRRFTHVETFDWTSEQYSGGCYTSTHSVKTLTKFGRHLREPFGRIHYAGTETAVKWSGYMDGAISAGKRAAREVLVRLGKLGGGDERTYLRAVWRAEPESRSVPPVPFEYPKSHRWALSVDLLARSARVGLLVGLLAVGGARLIDCDCVREFLSQILPLSSSSSSLSQTY